MTTLDTLCVRLEAEAGSLFQDLDTLEHRLTALRGQSGQRVSLPAELEMRLSVTADEAIAGALRGAGDTLSAAVQGHDVQLGGALAEAQQAMAAALQSAANKLSASLNVNVPVYTDSTRVANAVVNQVGRRLVSGGRSLA